MPICYFCEQFTGTEEKDKESGDLHCHNCGKKIMDKGILVDFSLEQSPVPEKQDKKEDITALTTENTAETKSKPAFTLILCAFFVGAVLSTLATSFYFTKKSPPISDTENMGEIHQEQPTEGEFYQDFEENKADFTENKVNLLFQEGIDWGDSVSKLTQDNTEIFPLSQEGTHFATFEAGLFFQLEEPVPIQKIFYFFDQNFCLESVEYSLKEEENLMDTLVFQLSEQFILLEDQEEFALWQGLEGFVGLHKKLFFLHMTEEEEKLRAILES